MTKATTKTKPPTQYKTCDVCGRMYALRGDCSLRVHRDLDKELGRDGKRPVCAGSPDQPSTKKEKKGKKK